MCSTAPRCSTSSPTSLLFVFSSAVRFATSERQNSGTPGMARPPRLRTHTGRKHTRVMVRELRNIVKTQESRLSHPLHTGHTGVTPSPNRRVCLVSAETQIQLLLLCQLAVVHVDHQKSSTKTDWIWHVYSQRVQRRCLTWHLCKYEVKLGIAEVRCFSC